MLCSPSWVHWLEPKVVQLLADPCGGMRGGLLQAPSQLLLEEPLAVPPKVLATTTGPPPDSGAPRGRAGALHALPTTQVAHLHAPPAGLQGRCKEHSHADTAVAPVVAGETHNRPPPGRALSAATRCTAASMRRPKSRCLTSPS